MKKRAGCLSLLLGLGLVYSLGQNWARVHPQGFFHYTVRRGHLELSSDEPFAADQGREILALVAAKLARSTLYDPSQTHRAFISNARWRQRIFMPAGAALGGVNYYPLTNHVFLGAARVYSNRVVAPEGWTVGGARTLDYYVTHEMTHTLVGQRAGGFARVPEWLNEGYADWIGLGPDFSYARAWDTYARRNPAYDRDRSGRYLRYDVMVAHLMDRQKATVEQLLAAPPVASEVEKNSQLPPI